MVWIALKIADGWATEKYSAKAGTPLLLGNPEA